MKICVQCGGKHHARGMCFHHYSQWYHANRDEAKRIIVPKQRCWKFTPETWWSWWEDRMPDRHTLERRASIQSMRYRLP